MLYSKYTNTFWNTIECGRGFEDIKDEISSSVEASDIFGLIFYRMCYFWVENLSNLCKLIVCGNQTLRCSQQTHVQRFPENRSTQLCIFTVENSAYNNQIHTKHSKSVHTTCMVSNPTLQHSRQLLDPLNGTM